MPELLDKLALQGQRTFWIFFVCTLLVIYAMQISGAPLVNEVAPAGIVDFELVGSLSGSQEIMASWEGSALAWAKINMILDFLFLTCYGLTIALASLLVSAKLKQGHPKLAGLGQWSALGILFAAVLDVIENLALLALLFGAEKGWLALLARWMAIPKFSLVLISLIYVLVGVVVINLMKVWELRKVSKS